MKLRLDGKAVATEVLKSINLNDYNIALQSTVTHGHGVASKASKKYPDGTIQLQYPFFKNLGLDLGNCFPGTLNLSIHPMRCLIENPTHIFKDVDWYPARGSTENFTFCDCAIKVDLGYIGGHVYLPDPKTKIENYDREDILQMISPRIPGLLDDQVVFVYLKAKQCKILEAEDKI